MGIDDSPLRDRVVFVQGVPRSGTTVLLALLAAHPQIVGSEAESHLFDYGVDRLFDNFDGRHPHLRGLTSYVEHREELVDLVRDLCDGILMSMRSHIGQGGEHALAVEKTPTSVTEEGRDLRRKLECFPDAWYLHIVRDHEAVTRSLMRAPWLPDRSRAACSRMASEALEVTREVLGDHPRYREVSFEQLRVDPVPVIGELYEWLGLEADSDALETVGVLSREQFSELGAASPVQASGGTLAGLRSRTAASASRSLDRVKQRLTTRSSATSEETLSHEFVRALRTRDRDSLKALTTERLSVVYRGAEGDLFAEGLEAQQSLFDLGVAVFGRGHEGEVWTSTGVGTGEDWTSAPGQPFSLIHVSALGGNASRVDLALCLSVKDDLIARVVVITAGPLEGRPLRALPPGAFADSSASSPQP